MRTSYGALTAVRMPIKEIADVPICGFFRWLSLFALVLIFPVCGGVVTDHNELLYLDRQFVIWSH